MSNSENQVIINKYLGHADHAVSDIQKTLEGVGLSFDNAAYTGTVGNVETKNILDKFDNAKGNMTLSIAVQLGSAVLGAQDAVVKVREVEDANGNKFYQAAIKGAVVTVIADSIAGATAGVLASAGISAGAVIGTEVAIALHAATVVGEANDYFWEGFPNILGGTRWDHTDIDGTKSITSGWSLQDMLNESMYETIFIHGEKNLKDVYVDGNSFRLKAIENSETYFSYDAENEMAHYGGTFEQASSLTRATKNGQSDIDAMAKFFDKGEFKLETKSGEIYTIYSIADLSATELVTLAREHKVVFDTLMNLKSGNTIIEKFPMNMGSNDHFEVLQYSDEYLEERAKFLKQKVLQEEETFESTTPYTYTDNETDTKSYRTPNMLMGDRPTYFGGHEGKLMNSFSTDLFGSRQGNQTADTIEGSTRKDYVEGLDGSDIIRTYAGDDIIYTNAKGLSTENDKEDSSITNRVWAGAGNDEVYGSNGIDIVYGGIGNDIIEGRGGDDELYGGKGSDIIDGGAGNDILYSNGKDGKEGFFKGDYDVLRGGTGNDELHGGMGRDLLEGGEDFDTYYAVNKNVIDDSDGLGEIHFKDEILGQVGEIHLESTKTITRNEELMYQKNPPIHELLQYTDGKFNYSLVKGEDTLKVKHIKSGEIITIKNFKSGDLGIVLDKKELDESKVTEHSATPKESINPEEKLGKCDANEKGVVLERNSNKSEKEVEMLEKSLDKFIEEHSTWVNEILENSKTKIDTTAKAHEIISNMNLPQQDNSRDSGRDID